jgi:hypothetical protein
MASSGYLPANKSFMSGGIDLTTATIKVRMVRVSGYTFANTHATMTSIGAGVGTDVTLGTKLVNAGAVDGVFDAADAVFTAVTAGAAIDACVIYKFGTIDGDSVPIMYLDGFSVTPNGGDITLQWAAASPFIWKMNP